jgi:hypothetical protein
VLATLSGVLIAPISEMDPTSYTLFVVPALGAALIGRFSSFGATAAAGLALGVIQSEIVHLQTVFTWPPQQGLGDGVPFVLILVVMTLSGCAAGPARALAPGSGSPRPSCSRSRCPRSSPGWAAACWATSRAPYRRPRSPRSPR